MSNSLFMRPTAKVDESFDSDEPRKPFELVIQYVKPDILKSMRKESGSLASSPRGFTSILNSALNSKASDKAMRLNMSLINNITSET